MHVIFTKEEIESIEGVTDYEWTMEFSCLIKTYGYTIREAKCLCETRVLRDV